MAVAMLKDDLRERKVMEESVVDVRNIYEDEGVDVGASTVLIRPRSRSEARGRGLAASIP